MKIVKQKENSDQKSNPEVNAHKLYQRLKINYNKLSKLEILNDWLKMFNNKKSNELRVE